MGRHIDNISEALLKEINEDIYDLNINVKEMGASVEALQSETIKVFEQQLRNLDTHFIDLLERSKKDIEDEVRNRLLASEKKEVSQKNKRNWQFKITSILMLFVIVSALLASFTFGRHFEQSRYDQLIDMLPYMESINSE